MLQISHREDDLHLIGFTFDEVQVVNLEDDSKDMVTMSFDQYNNTMVLSMMRGMSYMPGLGLGRCQQGPREFTFTVDHDIPYGLGYTPTEDDARHMARLCQDRMRARLSGDQASVFSMCFPNEVPDCDLPMDLGDGYNGVTLLDTYLDEMDMIDIGCILDTTPHGPHFAFDIFGVFVIDSDDVTLYDACIDEMDMIGIGRILDASPPRPQSGVFNSVDPLFSFDTMFGFVTRFDDISDVPQHMYAMLMMWETQMTHWVPKEIRIGSSLSPDERSRLIDLLRSYLDAFAWSYEDMPSLDPSIVQHHLPILPHARLVKQKLRRLHPRWSLQVKEEIQKQFTVGFLSVVKYLEWLANVVPVPKKKANVRVCIDFRDLNKANSNGSRGYGEDFHDMMHRDVEVYVDDMIVKSQDKADHLAALQRFFKMIRQFGLRLNPKKCTFGVTSGKLLGHIVSERGIEVDPEKIRAILDMPAPRTEREVRGFLGKLQYISHFIARLSDICEPIFRLLRKNQPTVWNDDCQRVFEKIKECLFSPPVLVPPTPRRLLLLYLSVLDMTLGCMLVLTGRLMRWLVLLTEFDIQYVTRKSVKRSIVVDHLASLPVSDDRLIDDDFPYEQFISVTSIEGWWLYFDGAANQVENQFADALATLASVIEIPAGVIVRPLLIETRFAPAYCCLIGDIDDQDELPWYHDIYQFLECDAYLESASAKDRRALRQLATRFVICRDALYSRLPNGLLLLCLDRSTTDKVMREVHAEVCGPHMGGHMLAHKIMRTGYFWLNMETNCCQFVQRCPECQMHGDLIHMPLSKLQALIFPWGIDIIGKISPKSSNGHEYILVAIDYFTKSHIIYRYGVPHELISNIGVHFRGEVDTLVQEYGIQHHISSTYRLQTNGAVEAANKNIKRILRKMVETSRDWSEKLPFALWAYRTSFHTSIGATPYSLVYGMEAMLPVEIEMGSLRITLEQQIFEPSGPSLIMISLAFWMRRD
ncbi:Retrovirus-related Pol polyprotein from transposon 17.6 [Vitis vinifera]|uniref:Retrovirus-related Pol polyprotein from transposon 17.6 n=1 Tax=Vitis vinifera TaxID=29760 RepID=A0A438GN70_VITVI|nr:Retrovirus-related Pol polyprotein from transposon 17.6 [Vitis vinifera]